MNNIDRDRVNRFKNILKKIDVTDHNREVLVDTLDSIIMYDTKAWGGDYKNPDLLLADIERRFID